MNKKRKALFSSALFLILCVCLNTTALAGQCTPACPAGKICLYENCKSADWVISAGNVTFVPTAVLHGISALMSVPVFVASLEDRMGIMSVTGMLAAGQGLGMISFGSISQIPRHKQKRFLVELDSQPEKKLLALGWTTTVLAFISSGLVVVGDVSENRVITVSAASTGVALSASSFFLNLKTYSAQRKRLREAVGLAGKNNY